MRILVIEDDRDGADLIREALEREAFAVDILHDGADAGDQASCVDYDAVVLDLILPTRSGFQVLRDLRAVKPTLPVVMVTGRGGVEDRVAGLNGGADDYLVKPFSMIELIARLRAVLRRGQLTEAVLQVADLQLDQVRRTVRRGTKRIELKPKEYSLLAFLMRHSDRPLARHTILEHVWDLRFDQGSNVLDVHIHSLRNKLDRDFANPLLHTIRHVGYMLSDNTEH